MPQTVSGSPLSDALRLHPAGRLYEAERACRAPFVARPNAPEALGLLGTLLDQTGRLEESRDTLRHAVALNPDDANAHYNLGECFRRLDETASAFGVSRRHRCRCASLSPRRSAMPTMNPLEPSPKAPNPRTPRISAPRDCDSRPNGYS